MKHRCFEKLCFVIIDELQFFHRNHQCFLKESSMQQMLEISTIKTLIIINVYRNHQCFFMLHRCLFNEQACPFDDDINESSMLKMCSRLGYS